MLPMEHRLYSAVAFESNLNIESKVRGGSSFVAGYRSCTKNEDLGFLVSGCCV